jgi:hypothetical protein
MEPTARDIAAKFFAPDDPKYDALVREIAEAFENALDDYRLNSWDADPSDLS